MKDRDLAINNSNTNLDNIDFSKFVLLVDNEPKYDIVAIKNLIYEEYLTTMEQSNSGKLINPLNMIIKAHKINVNLKYSKLLKSFLDSLDNNLFQIEEKLKEINQDDKEIIVKAMGDSLIHVKSELEGIIRSYNLEYNKKLF